MHNHDHDHHGHFHDHEHTLKSELFHHLPYAIFSVAFSLIILSFVTLAFKNMPDTKLAFKGAKMLFHSFHFMRYSYGSSSKAEFSEVIYEFF